MVDVWHVTVWAATACAVVAVLSLLFRRRSLTRWLAVSVVLVSAYPILSSIFVAWLFLSEGASSDHSMIVFHARCWLPSILAAAALGLSSSPRSEPPGA
jgi:hypothetical protein